MKKLFLLLGFIYSILFFNYSYGQWQQTSLKTEQVYCFAINGSNILAGAYDGTGVFLSTNNGTSWNAINNGLPIDTSFDNPYLNVYSLGIIGTNILVGGDYSYDTGSYYNGIYLSSNNGLSWNAVKNGMPDSIGVYSLAISGTNLFAGTCGKGIFLSTNNGISWVAFRDNGLPSDSLWNESYPYYTISLLVINGKDIFAGTYGEGAEGLKGLLYLFTDNGANWSDANNGLLNVKGINSLAISGKNIFLGTWGGGGIFLSTDNGTNWSAINNGLPYNTDINSIVINGSNIIAGTDNGGGIFLSTNNGANWLPANKGLTDSTIVNSLAINEEYIFAGTDEEGVWKCKLSDILGINDLSNDNFINIYPNPTDKQLTISFQQFANMKVS